MDVIRIRPASDADLPAIARLANEVAALHHRAHPTIFAEPGNLGEHEAFWRSQVAEGGRFWAAVAPTAHDSAAEEETVGFASARVVDEAANALTQAMRPCRIGTIGVAGNWRRRGVGKSLIDAVLDDAAAECASEVRLNVFLLDARAIAFYARLGFVARTQIMARPLHSRTP